MQGLAKTILVVGSVSACVVAEAPEEPDCLEWVDYPVIKVECTGGRGVAPLVCVEKIFNETSCATYWAPPKKEVASSNGFKKTN